ncbi:MAG: DAK2 domain-containing protein, partial [Clostridiales bacterium]|nr:DAK2 domain-containing protein [Clostridiales bacterium]
VNPMQLRSYLETIGDSIVFVDSDDFIKVHVHTNDPGKALQEAALYGEFENVKIENMCIQHNNTQWVETSIESKIKKHEKEVGFVVVAAGEGLKSLFYELGCDQVVSGGQTMNPSTDDFLRAIESTPAKVVFVLPNNKNIIMAAEQAIPLADRTVYVLPTNTIPQGISAMMNFDPDTPVEDNLTLMMQAADYVSSGLVTYATRDSVINGQSIKKGQVIALNDNKIVHVDNDIQNATAILIKHLIESRQNKGKDVEFITLIYGENMTEEDAEAVRDTIMPELDDLVEVSIVNGKQPLYYYIISID